MKTKDGVLKKYLSICEKYHVGEAKRYLKFQKAVRKLLSDDSRKTEKEIGVTK